MTPEWPTGRPRCGWRAWSVPDDDHAYICCPAASTEEVHVKCPNCGADHVMPMDGRVPIIDGMVDWDRLNPFLVRFAQGLRRSCEQSEPLRAQ